MITTIVKRNGRKEDFSPEKLNKWGEWASHSLSSYVDWPTVVIRTVSSCPSECSSALLQQRLIKTCLDMGTWSYNRMAGRLYAAMLTKDVFGNSIPTVKELHEKLVGLGYMEDLGYSDEEYQEIEKLINHKKDYKASYCELDTVCNKYAISNKVTKELYETQQFVYMRMAMALASLSTPERKLVDVAYWYKYLSNKNMNAPTPNYVNLGTPLKGFASCCLYTTADNAASLAIGDHIAYTMTYMSAGIGSHINTRSIGDPVRGGVILHQGKLNYYRALVGAVKANLQNGRGGACTTYYNCFDPEAFAIAQLKNPMSTEDKKIRGLDYNFGSNTFFARKAAKNEEIIQFNSFTAPELYDALYSSDEARFETLYQEAEQSGRYKKISAREILITALSEGYETGRHYLHNILEMNRHTPFKEKIFSSNLCAEICEPTKPYTSMMKLYAEDGDDDGEVAMCSLAGINVDNTSEEEYENVCYYALLMIDRCIHMSKYPLPHIGFTTKQRLNAGVGIIGLAHLMAKSKKMYSNLEGKKFIHQVAERHCYNLIKASLRLSKELGVAPWMHKTKWPEGWLPLDTYNRNVDSVCNPPLQYDWEELRKQIIENGGIRNSCLIAHMPSETSSKASGTTNGVYPIRDLSLLKSDNSRVVDWCAPDGEKLVKWYELAWDIPSEDIIDVYAIIQKWTDQAISADLYRKIIGDEKVKSSEMLKLYFYMIKMGMKTRYYQNVKTTDGTVLEEEMCPGGSCTL